MTFLKMFKTSTAAACLLAASFPVQAETEARQSFSTGVAGTSGYADLVEVSPGSKTLFLWGVGAEEETSTTPWRPDVRHRGDFAAQCSYAVDKLGRMLATRDATFDDVTIIRAYVTDGRYSAGIYDCLNEVYGDSEAKPAVTVANISQLAHVGMLMEMEVTAALPGDEADTTFSVYRNTETLGTWNPGANEVLEAAGPDRTFYFSGAQAVKYVPGERMVSMFPGDFAKQCVFLQEKLVGLLHSEGATGADVVRSTTFLTGDAGLGDLLKCRGTLPDGDKLINPGTLANISQLSALGEVNTYDSIGMAALTADQDATVFARKIVPSDLNPDVPAAVIVSGPRRTLNVAGIGSLDDAGEIANLGDFAAQCSLTLEKIDTLLKTRDASLTDIAKMLVFVTDSRNAPDFRECMAKAYPNGNQPAQTFVNVARLPVPGMLLQIDATAVTAR